MDLQQLTKAKQLLDDIPVPKPIYFIDDEGTNWKFAAYRVFIKKNGIYVEPDKAELNRLKELMGA